MATKPATGFAARSNRLKGISWSEQRQKWRAQIKKNKKNAYLGIFDCPAAAHFAYLIAHDELFRDETPYSSLRLSVRDAAIAKGEKFYFTGRPCKNGHICERRVIGHNCVECQKIANDAYGSRNPERHRLRYRSNREDLLEYARKWRERNPEKARASWVSYRQRNPHKSAEAAAAYRAKYPEKARASKKLWNENNHDKTAADARNRRARLKQAKGHHTADDISRIFKMQSGKCALCKSKISGRGFHVDHIVAIARGGTNDARNLQVLCVQCNCEKHTKDQIEFMQSRGGLL